MMNNWMIALIHKLRMELMRVNNGGRLMKSFGVFIITIGLALMFEGQPGLMTPIVLLISISPVRLKSPYVRYR